MLAGEAEFRYTRGLRNRKLRSSICLPNAPRCSHSLNLPATDALMKYFVWLLVGLMLVLQQDYWQWGKHELVWGALPYTLVWQAGVSLLAAAVWGLAVTFCWPQDLDDPAADKPAPDASRREGAA